MTRIELEHVTVDLPIFSAHNMNLKRRIINLLTLREEKIASIRALHDISLLIDDGDRIGIVGPNGAGKTTLLRVIAGILNPSSGRVQITGTVVSMIDQGLGLDPQCTGIENIYRRGIYLGQSEREMTRQFSDIVEFSGLGSRIEHPVYTYSAGMKARLSFSISTSIRPDILILDAGFAAADEEFASRASDRLNTFMMSAGILVLATHSKQLIEAWCNRTISLEAPENRVL